MNTRASTLRHRRVLNEMLSLPTAPFAEHKVAEYIESFCKRLGKVAKTRDSAGNILVAVRKGSRGNPRPVCITAHMDHPGFVADAMVTRGRVRAFWRGGVPAEYFVGGRVRFFVNGATVGGRIRSVTTVAHKGQRRVNSAVMAVSGEVPRGSVGMWDFPDPTVRGTRIYARACDDVAGAAALLCCIDRLARESQACNALFLFTRAEEVGFVGAIAAARMGTIPKGSAIVAMETSSQRPNAKMGDGPILRVGDKSSTFFPAATAYCQKVADDLARRDRTFKYQRKLMDGGTCESSAYCTLGYQATGICLALGNYHNVDAARKRLGPEYIDLGDFDNVVKWFVALAREKTPYNGRDENLRTLVNDLERRHRVLLRASRDAPC